MGTFPMRACLRLAFAFTGAWLIAAVPVPAHAQASPIPRVVVDLRGATTGFKKTTEVADGIGLTTADLPGRAFGGDLAVHFYPVSWHGITFGLGGSFALLRSTAALSESTAALGRGSNLALMFKAYSPQLSFNFGGETGWSYISGGLGFSTLAYSIDGTGLDAETPRRKTINYGAGGRWFVRERLAFSLDIRAYAVNPVAASPQTKPSPRMTLLTIGAGISFR